ncbi:MAG: trypsin-like serine protease [Gemmataceae bacterium]
MERLEDRTVPAVGATFYPPIVTPGTGFDGVVRITWQVSPGAFGVGSGVLLYDGRHVLTAAHVVSDKNGALLVRNNDITFELPNGDRTITIPASQASTLIHVYPGWTGNWGDSRDIAIIELPEIAPGGRSNGFDLYRNTDEVGQTYTMMGYGMANNDGNLGSEKPDGTLAPGAIGAGVDKRESSNVFEFADTNYLKYDFDDGTAAHDAGAIVYGVSDLGLGNNTESIQAGGDSGGPFFLGNRIAGVVSGRASSSVDVSVNDSTFGEIGVLPRISSFASWIDSQIDDSNVSVVLNMGNQPVGADGNADTIRVTLDGSLFDLYVNGVLYYRDSPSDIASIRIVGSSDPDSLVVDFRFGNAIPVGTLGGPPGGLSFDGSFGGVDQITLVGGNFDTVTHGLGGKLSFPTGRIDFSDGTTTTTIGYVNTEFVHDRTVAKDLFINSQPFGGTQMYLGDDGLDNDVTVVSAFAGPLDVFATLDFYTPGRSLTLNGDDDPNQITVLPLDANFNKPVFINGLGGKDTIDAQFCEIPLWITGGPGDDVITGGANTDLISGGEGNDTISAGGTRTLTFIGTSPSIANSAAALYLRDVQSSNIFRFVCNFPTPLPQPQLDTGRIAASGWRITPDVSGAYRLLFTSVRPGFLITGNILYGAVNEGVVDIVTSFGRARYLMRSGDNNVMLGDAGDDTIFGGNGRDILIGGIGADHLYGGRGEDILIGGATWYDNYGLGLVAMLNEWNSQRDYATRIANLSGTGSGPRLNNGYFLNRFTVIDDSARDELFGDPVGSTLGDLDWFFQAPYDALMDRKAGETITNY